MSWIYYCSEGKMELQIGTIDSYIGAWRHYATLVAYLTEVIPDG